MFNSLQIISKQFFSDPKTYQKQRNLSYGWEGI